MSEKRICTCHPEDRPPIPCEQRYSFRECSDAAEARKLQEVLDMLYESYQMAAKPYVDRLAVLHGRGVPQIFIPVEYAGMLSICRQIVGQEVAK